jgi:DNA-directed RNA polymerase specialized sigma24 family protein
MRRSEAVQLILDTYHKGMSVKEKMMSGMESDQADKILTALEQAGMVPPLIGDDFADVRDYYWEPEEGWDAYFAEQEKKDQARDFQVIARVNHITGEYTTTVGMKMAQTFLEGKSFEEIAQEYNVTRERIRQIVNKQRRRYQKYMEGKSDEQ